MIWFKRPLDMLALVFSFEGLIYFSCRILAFLPGWARLGLICLALAAASLVMAMRRWLGQLYRPLIRPKRYSWKG